MALDEAILDSVISGDQPPTLRLYAWEPACLSLGHAQPVSNVDLTALQSRGWHLVRRPTGGRAILHTDELTYSVCARQDAPVMMGGILDSYQRISRALIAGLASIGIDANAESQYAVPQDSTPNGAVCFEVPSNYEITTGGKKLIGSAQARRRLGVLQHGSLPLFGDLARITDVLQYDNAETRLKAKMRLLDHATTAEIVLGTAPAWNQATTAMISAFIDQLDIDLIQSSPTKIEILHTEQLITEKYSNPSWTHRI